MKHILLALLIAVTVHHNEVKKEHEHNYKSILDFDPDKQELFVICCERKRNPKSPMEHLPPVTAF